MVCSWRNGFLPYFPFSTAGPIASLREVLSSLEVSWGSCLVPRASRLSNRVEMRFLAASAKKEEQQDEKHVPVLLNVYTDVDSPKAGDIQQRDQNKISQEVVQQQQQQKEGASVQEPSTAIQPCTKCPVPIGKRVFCDEGINLERGQPWWLEAFALVTMALYLSWANILLVLVAAAFFSKTALWVCIGE